jgi:hypothetical protein
VAGTSRVKARSRRLAVVLGALAAAVGAPDAWAAPSLIEQRRELLAEPTALAAAARVQRRWRLSELEARAGNPDLAVAAARDALKLSGIAATIEALTGESQGAGARLDDSVRRALALGARSGDAELVLDALAWRPEAAKGEPNVLRAALLAHPFVADMGGARQLLAAALAGDPAWQAFGERHWEVGSGLSRVDAAYIDASVVDLLPLLTDGRVEVTALE